MKPMNRDRPEVRIGLSEMAGDSAAWGTAFGALLFGQINMTLLGLGEGTLVLVDYSGIERTDVSFQREAVVETLRKHRPRLLFTAVNLVDPDVTENLNLALERRGESLLVRQNNQIVVLGKKLTPEQSVTLNRVWEAGEVTSSDLESKEVKLSTASSRLSALWKAGLLERVEGTAPTGGREHRYIAVT